MMQPTNRRTLLFGLAFIVLSNAIALAGVVYNRSGEPTSSMTLTERELSLPSQYGFTAESSGISLRLRWRDFDRNKTNLHYSYWTPTKWLDADKLRALGFDVAYPLNKRDSPRRYQKILSKEVYLVLEYDGATHKQVLQQRQAVLTEAQQLQQQNSTKKEFEARLKKASADLQAEQYNNSRLYVMDAGLDPASLRQQYRDKSKYLILRGQIKLSYQGRYDKKPYLRGIVKQLSVINVNVPLAHASVLTPLLDKKYKRKPIQPPRYEISLQYGQRYEPWVVGVNSLQ